MQKWLLMTIALGASGIFLMLPSEAQAYSDCRTVCTNIRRCYTTNRCYQKRYCYPRTRCYRQRYCIWSYGTRVCSYTRRCNTYNNCSYRNYCYPVRRCYTRPVCAQRCNYY